MSIPPPPLEADLPPEALRVLALAQRHATPCGDGEVVWHTWGTGEPLVLLHGGSGSWTHWIRNVEALAAAGRRVVVPDLPAESVIGVEAAIWTETLVTVDELTEMLLPRLTALAEVAWTVPGRRSWDSYRRRVAAHRDYWDLVGVRWYPSPQVDW